MLAPSWDKFPVPGHGWNHLRTSTDWLELRRLDSPNWSWHMLGRIWCRLTIKSTGTDGMMTFYSMQMHQIHVTVLQKIDRCPSWWWNHVLSAFRQKSSRIAFSQYQSAGQKMTTTSGNNCDTLTHLLDGISRSKGKWQRHVRRSRHTAPRALAHWQVFQAWRTLTLDRAAMMTRRARSRHRTST